MKIGSNNYFSPASGPPKHTPGIQSPFDKPLPGGPSYAEEYQQSTAPMQKAPSWPAPQVAPQTPQEPPATPLAEAPPPPPPPPAPASPVGSPKPKTESWMAGDWNLGPAASQSVLPEKLTDSMPDTWKFPKPDSKLHTKMMVIDDQATYFVGGNNTPNPTKSETDPLLADLAAIANKAMAAKKPGVEQMKAGFAKQAGAMLGGVAGAMLGGLGAAGLVNSYVDSLKWPVDLGAIPGGFNKSSAQLHEKGHAFSPPEAKEASPKAPLAKTEELAAAAPLQATRAVEAPKLPTCAGLNKAEVVAGVNKTLKSMGVSHAGYIVDEKLFPSLEKLDLNPVDFFAARACWQGVNTKRRALLEKVLDQFPTLPKDQKNWQAAVAAVEAKGEKVSETDRFFVGYFIDNRQKMKSLFRATLPSGFEGKNAVCYRGQDNSSKWGPHSTKPLGCYSIDPSVSESWSSGNFKRFKVKLNDVWSTYTTLQNNHRCERELTVYSPGGIRRGEPVKDATTAKSEFKKRYATDKIANGLEVEPWKEYVS